MSVEIMSKVFKCNMPELKTDKGKTVPDSTAKFVLLALADHANDEGEGAYPSVKTICKKTNLSTATVVNALNALRTNGFTELVGRSKRETYNYTILVAKIAGFQWLESDDSSGYNGGVLAAKTESSSNHPVKPSIKDNGASALKASQVPELVLFRAVTGRYPARDTFEVVITNIQKVRARLGRDVTAGDLLPFWQKWRSNGWKPTNLAWLTDWAVSGSIPGYSRPSQPATPAAPAQYTQAYYDLGARIRAQKLAAGG